MKTRKAFSPSLASLLLAGVLVLACSQSAPPKPEEEGPPLQNPPPVTTPTAQPPAAPAPPATPPPAPKTPATSPPAPPVAAPVAKPPSPPMSEPAPPAAPAATAPQPVPAAPPPAATNPAPPAEPSAPTHAAVGSEKCKMCHRLQYESWAASRHAQAAPPLGCEGCHGNGADYIKISVMKDRAQAEAGGLRLPGRGDCTRCHKEMDDATFSRVHAHKAR